MSAFVGTIGIDYSGAETPNASLKGLRVYLAEGAAQVEGWILGVPGLIRAHGEMDDPASTACNTLLSSLH